MKDISIVVPVYNSEDNLEELTKQLNDALKSVSFEIIFINDYSRDNSWKVIKRLAEDNNVVGINLMKNFGQDNAIMAGLNISSGNYVVIMDDDLQHSPYDVLKLYDKCKEGFDVCYGKFHSKKQKLWKNFGSWFNGKVAEILINKPKGVYLSPFEILSRNLVNEIIKYKGPYPYIQGLILNRTSNFTEINIAHHKRYKGRGNFNFSRSMSVFLKLATSFSVIPLRIATLIGFLTSIIGFVMSIYYILYHYFGNYKVEGFTTLIVVVLTLGGLILLSLGIIGEYLGRMYLNINNKPQYTIDEVVGKNN